MSPASAGFDRFGKVVVQVQVRGAGDVTLGVAATAGPRIREIEAAIEHPYFGWGQCDEIPGTD